MLRRIPLGNMTNLRDLGGYPLPGGGVTAWGRLLRGDVPTGIGDREAGWLIEKGITTVVDLRSEEEAERMPDELAGRRGIAYFHIPLVGGERLPNLEEDVGKSYFGMMERQEAPRQVFQTIACAPEGVLFHCTAGKDRTGCVAAVLLALAGVDQVDILADYVVTELYIREVISRVRREHPNAKAYIGRSRAEYMEAFFLLLEEAHGCAEGYLRWLGLTEKEIRLLRGKVTGQEGQE